MSLRVQVEEAFRAEFGAEPEAVIRAPGRVNLIGEHTDYNDGFVLPMAIDQAVWIALRQAPGAAVAAYSVDFGERRGFELADVASRREQGQVAEGWLEYLKGMAWALADAGHRLRGWQGVVAGDVPIGAGLSSSAALELATARAFATVSDLPWDPAAMALLGQKAENQWVGVNCGIMDQMISAAGREGHALLLDCRSLDSELVPLPPGVAVVVLDTGTRRGLVDSAYNERRSQCESAAAHFGVNALRDVSAAQFEKRAGELDEVTRKRARHVIAEIERTVEAAAAMKSSDAAHLGALMDASHESLRSDFEVSSEALDVMVDCARAATGCLGARMTGAGFGGCAVALVGEAETDGFAEVVAGSYRERTGNEPSVYVCSATDGAAVMVEK